MAIRTKKLTGPDTFDLDRQQWELRNAVPRGADETLPLQAEPRELGRKLLAQDRVSRLVQYEE